MIVEKASERPSFNPKFQAWIPCEHADCNAQEIAFPFEADLMLEAPRLGGDRLSLAAWTTDEVALFLVAASSSWSVVRLAYTIPHRDHLLTNLVRGTRGVSTLLLKKQTKTINVSKEMAELRGTA